MNYPITLQNKHSLRLATWVSPTLGYFLEDKGGKTTVFDPDSWQPVPEQPASRVYKHKPSGAVLLRLADNSVMVLSSGTSAFEVGEALAPVGWAYQQYTPIDITVEPANEFVPHLRRGKVTGDLVLLTSPTEGVYLKDGTRTSGVYSDSWEKVKIV